MRVILNIARAELRYFFYSPIAWFLLILFLMSSAGIVMGNLADTAVQQDAMLELKGSAFEGFLNMPLTRMVIGKGIDTVLMIFFLFIPLLTMGVINRDYAAGTIKLLHSSPVTIRQIVLGKFLGVYSFVCMMIMLFVALVAVLTFSIREVEVLHIAAMLLGFFLLAAMYVAVGMFISSLTTYPIVAGIGTFVTLTLFASMALMFQGTDYVRDVTWFLSSSGRVESLLAGLLNTKDIIYFLAIITFFITCTIIRTKSVTESRSWRVSAMRYGAALAVTVSVLVVTAIHGFIGYWDVTRGKVNTLHPNTQEVLKKLDGSPLKVTLYTNLFGENLMSGVPEARNKYLWNFWARYRRFYTNIEFDYVYYYDVITGDSTIYKSYPGKTMDEVAEKYAEVNKTDLAIYKKPAEIRSIVDLESEGKGLLMQLEYKGKKSIMRTFTDPEMWPSERNVSGALMRVMEDTTPTIKFLTGHLERSPFKFGSREYGNHTNNKAVRNALVNLGVNTDTVSMPPTGAFNRNEVLVITDPKTVFDKALIDSVKQYIDNGGNAIFYTEPGKQFIMNPILNHVGVNAEEGTIVRVNKHDMPHKFVGMISKKGADLADEDQFFYQKSGVRGTCITAITGAGVLTYSDTTGFKAEQITTLENSMETWVERGVLVVDSAAPVFNPAEGDFRKEGPYPVGLQLTRKTGGREQRIIISSDADFMSSGHANGRDYGNAFYSFTLDNRYPVYHNFAVPKDIWLNISKAPARLLKLTLQYGIPALLLVAGIVILIRRKRK